MTGMTLESKTLIPNNALRQAIEEYLSNEARSAMAKHLEYKAQSEKKLAAGTQIDKRVNLLIVGPFCVRQPPPHALTRTRQSESHRCPRPTTHQPPPTTIVHHHLTHAPALSFVSRVQGRPAWASPRC